MLALAVLATACGGDDTAEDESAATTVDDEGTDTTESGPDAEPTIIATVVPLEEPTPTPVPVPPTPTPIPTLTPIPLEPPTPTAILTDTAFTNDSKVTTVGIDEVFFGMTADEAAEAASTEWVGEPVSTSTCYLVTPANGPAGVELWVVNGRVERVDITNPDLRTPSQLGVGDSLDTLQSQLGDRLSDETTDDGRVIATFVPADANDAEFNIIFELEDDAVVTYRSGRVGIVDAAEC